MALTGIQIFKFLPGAKKTENANCKKCECATCMAFAMKLAKGDIEVNKCPFIDEELKQKFSAENRKPQAKVEFGSDVKVVIGDENVMFRHDKTFVNPTAFSVAISSEDINFDRNLRQVLNYKVNRVGNDYGVDSVTLINDGSHFESNAKIIFEAGIPVILIVNGINELNSIEDIIKQNKPLIYLKSQNIQELIEVSKIAPIVVDGRNPDEISDKTDILLKNNCRNIVLNLIQEVNSSIIEPLTKLRRASVEKKIEAFGFPVMISYKLSDNMALDTIKLTSLVCKYVNLIIVDKFNPALMTALITLRLNIYTDPQKPLQVESKLYEIGDVTPDSPVVVTTNFALTYFAVVNELESMSSGTYLIIPGLVSELKEEIEAELPEFNIIIGTNEATDLPEFLKNL